MHVSELREMLTNFHTHSYYCDGRASMQDFLRFALANGLSAYGVSSHAPTPFRNNWAMKESDVTDYLCEFQRLKKMYEGKMELYVGMEMDYLTTHADFVFQHFASLRLDYRIGSVHYLDPLHSNGGLLYWNVGGSTQNYDRALHTLYGDSIRQLLTRYNEQLLALLNTANIQILAHCDLASNIAEHYYGFTGSEPWYLDQLRQIFTTARDRGVLIEINTKHLIELHRTSPHQRYFPLLKQLDVPIQVNSDAHYPQDVTSGLLSAHHLLRSAGINHQRILLHGTWTDCSLMS